MVHFPIALVTLSVVADVAGFFTESRSLQDAAWWALAGGAAGAGLAIVTGLLDMNREEIEHEAHGFVHVHMKIGLVLFVLLAALTFWRWLIYMDSSRSPGSAYLAGAVIVFAITLFQGWVGGEIVYSHGVGVAPTGQGTAPAAKAKRRLAWLPGAAHANTADTAQKSDRASATTDPHAQH